MMAQNANNSSHQKPNFTDRILKIFSEVKPGESITVLILLFDVFLLLFSYSLLKPVREALILAQSEADLQLLLNTNLPDWLINIFKNLGGPQFKAASSGVQALVMLGFIPLYSWFVSRVKRLYLLIGVTGFYLINIVILYMLFIANTPFIGFIFYVWLGIFNMSMVAQFWSFANDIYTKQVGERLFPIIVIGQTAGAPLGAALAKKLVRRPTFQFILLAGTILLIYLGLSLIAHFREVRSSHVQDQKRDIETKKLIKGNGFNLIFKNRYIMLIAFLILMLNFVNTGGENMLGQIVLEKANAVSPEDTAIFVRAFYADFNLWVNITALLLQAFLVSRIVKYKGLKGVLLMLPFVALGVYGLIGLGIGFAATRWLKTAENSTDYSVMNTGRAMLWLPTTREEKYKAKQTVDTFFVRFGDMAAAIVFIVGTTVLSFGIKQLAWINVYGGIVWLLLVIAALRKHKQIVEH